MAYAAHFGIEPHLASLLARLAGGSVVPALKVSICRLRQALESEAIDTVRGGYQLTEVGMRECATAVEEFRAWVNQGRVA
jgi:hypothetical protein